ncbi:hypothetical protein PHLGIDRAFT_250270 [Phlebiopsis gigantea 11061_1 CR5-6]|uniref:Sterol regulatory element-binding protein cleavage-activating protein n=1 Tax=Phlebiopsis gigantea (strain 11061_1 CR5-6) TaxID=745531 RepID=A0A0C3SE97_PHLG1|nr:hypothetical protein PHLGIDRAFT_250270 [Phlebiopsis gigantea 11061_1 CR5-6]
MLSRARSFGIGFFRRFGVHCATHQIRLILVSSVVISCLLFPAIAVYSSTKTESFALSFRVFDALLTPEDLSTYFSFDDIRQIWEGHETLHIRDDSIARARCGKGGIVRLERILIHDAEETEETYSTLSQHALMSTLNFERRLSEGLARHGTPCVRSPQGRCLVLSPLAFWDYEEDLLLRDLDVLTTLGPTRNASAHGFTITTDMVLSGRDRGDDPGDAAYPVLTYFFPEADCLSNHGHNSWLNTVEEAAALIHSGTVVMTQEPQLLALEHEKESTPTPHPFVLTAFTYTAYLIFIVYFWRSMSRMTTVHSRIGLAFTGIVEIMVSTVTSLSVCALAGFRITMVPWEIFPIVVIFIGVENMFSIVDAVVKTSIALPVKERIAEGLAHAGTSNSLKLCTYNSVLGVIAFFSTGAVRQFCAFAIVVLVAHWFLVHTFFVTVLSIDIQRLELDELLRQGASLAPALVSEPTKAFTKQSRTKFGRMVTRVQRLLHGRPAKNISLVLLLAVTATLYYMTQPHAGKVAATASTIRNRNRLTKAPSLEGVPPAENIWRTLNPVNYDLVHIRVEAPTVVIVNNDATSEDPHALDRQQPRLEYERMHRSRWSRLWWRMARPLEWAVRVIVVPTFMTTTLLYGLLLYLLKDAELLQAQRNRKEPDSPTEDDLVPAVDCSVSFKALPRAFASDVDLIATSKDGNVIATVGLRSEFVLWRRDTQTTFTVDTTDVLLGSGGSTPSASSTITAIALNDRGTCVAVGTAAGVIGLWQVGQNRIQALPHLSAESLPRVTDVHFAPPSNGNGAFTPRRASGGRMELEQILGPIYAAYDNGLALKWSPGSCVAPTYIRPSRAVSVVKSMLLRDQPGDRLLVGFALDDGTLELCNLDSTNSLLPPDCCITAGNPADLVAGVYVSTMELEGARRTIVAAATHAGVVSMWDAQTRECMYILDDAHGPVSGVQLVPVPTRRCSLCRELPPESFLLCFSVPVHGVVCHRAYLSLPTRKCSCPRHQPRLLSSVQGRKTRSGSSATYGPSSGTSSPIHQRSRPASFSTTSAFDASALYPVSAHGAQLRRSSDKRALDAFVPFEADEEGRGSGVVGPQDLAPAATAAAALLTPVQQRSSSLWENLIVVRTAEVAVERGGWGVAGGFVVGVRRRPRVPMKGSTSGKGVGSSGPASIHSRVETKGLTPATLERWEFWTFNPSELQLYASPLLSLDEDTRLGATATTAQGMTKPSLVVSDKSNKRQKPADVVPRLHFTRVSPFICSISSSSSTAGPGSRSVCLAGFGNTVGLFDLGSPSPPDTRQRPSLERKPSG